MPFSDLAPCFKVNETRTQAIVQKMEKCLSLNQNPDKLGASKIEKTQGLFINSAQQEELDGVILQIKRQMSQTNEKVKSSTEAKELADKINLITSDVENNRLF